MKISDDSIISDRDSLPNEKITISALPPIPRMSIKLQHQEIPWLDKHIDSLDERIKNNEVQQQSMMREMMKIQADLLNSFKVYDMRLNYDESQLQK